MPNDAKFGLVVGVGLVITVAVVFFQNSAPSDPMAASQAAAALTDASPNQPALADAENPVSGGPVAARTMTFVNAPELSIAEDSPPSSRPVTESPRQHVIQPGDTLFSLAKQYYHDGDRFIDIYRANRNVLHNPDRLPVGTAIQIP